jgi:hypothetical protein
VENMNRSEVKYAWKVQLERAWLLSNPGVVQVVAVERKLIRQVKTGFGQGPRIVKLRRWYLVLGCSYGKKVWFGKVATSARVAKAVKTRTGL